MTGREQLKYEQTRIDVYNRAHGRCEECGAPIQYDTYQMAHKIPQSKMYLKKYGKEVIHHRLNFSATCSLICNGRSSIGCWPLKIDELVLEIRQELYNER